MAICPNCKLNYEDGIKICADCKCELVDKLPELDIDIPMYYDKDEEYINTLIDYLNYSKIKSVNKRYDEEQESFCIYTDSVHEKKVKRLLNTYFDNELKEEAQMESSEAETDISNENTEDSDSSELSPLDETNRAPANYVKKADKYKDLQGSAASLITVGILGDAYLVSKTLGLIKFGPVLNELSNILFLIVMGTLFNVFLVGGILAYKSSKTIKSEIITEEETTAAILDEFTAKTADELDSNYDTTGNEGIIYFNRTGYLKKQITEKYGELDEAYLEDLIEQIYQAVFDIS